MERSLSKNRLFRIQVSPRRRSNIGESNTCIAYTTTQDLSLVAIFSSVDRPKGLYYYAYVFYMYILTCIYIHTYIYIYTHTCTYKHMYMYANVYTNDQHKQYLYIYYKHVHAVLLPTAIAHLCIYVYILIHVYIARQYPQTPGRIQKVDPVMGVPIKYP